MKEFEKWEKDFYANHQGNFHFDPTCKMGWKAALIWVLENRKPYYDLEDKKVVATDSDIIHKELEE